MGDTVKVKDNGVLQVGSGNLYSFYRVVTARGEKQLTINHSLKSGEDWNKIETHWLDENDIDLMIQSLKGFKKKFHPDKSKEQAQLGSKKE